MDEDSLNGDVTRREALRLLAVAGVATACKKPVKKPSVVKEEPMSEPPKSAVNPVKSASPVPEGKPWQTADPFLFCVHHDDRYPKGNANHGPEASLAGRQMGQDFGRKDGWSMYHGHRVPGFPRHPHRGFETVTVVREGLVDHADSLGAAARYGEGDVQWLTAGDGINHAEMFPLLRKDAPNPIDFFQIWLNLPARNKRVKPRFAMLWDGTIPKITVTDSKGLKTFVTVVAGSYQGQKAPSPPPDSWASDSTSDLAILTMKMEPGARWTLPPTLATTGRTLYTVRGAGISIAGTHYNNYQAITLRADVPTHVSAAGETTELLLLQGRPIGEPVVKYGPFVMNTRQEIQQAFSDYRRTGFGGWPWQDDAPVHGGDAQRFARHADGRKERPS